MILKDIILLNKLDTERQMSLLILESKIVTLAEARESDCQGVEEKKILSENTKFGFCRRSES